MDASNKPDSPAGPWQSLLTPSLADAVRGMWDGRTGHTVRCVPTRRTIAAAVDGAHLFGKWRLGRGSAANAEWRWLHLLPLLGIRTAEPIVWIGDRRRSLLVTRGVAGRALDAWAVEAAHAGWLHELVDYVCREVAPAVRRLHDQGLVYRDLYWNHLFARDPRRTEGSEPPVFLDCERILRPRWRWHRWIVKDLASLWASVPVPVGRGTALRFLRNYLGESLHEHRGALLAIAAKAARIRRHVPRYG
jgi:hypothetical protein